MGFLAHIKETQSTTAFDDYRESLTVFFSWLWATDRFTDFDRLPDSFEWSALAGFQVSHYHRYLRRQFARDKAFGIFKHFVDALSYYATASGKQQTTQGIVEKATFLLEHFDKVDHQNAEHDFPGRSPIDAFLGAKKEAARTKCQTGLNAFARWHSNAPDIQDFNWGQVEGADILSFKKSIESQYHNSTIQNYLSALRQLFHFLSQDHVYGEQWIAKTGTLKVLNNLSFDGQKKGNQSKALPMSTVEALSSMPDGADIISMRDLTYVSLLMHSGVSQKLSREITCFGYNSETSLSKENDGWVLFSAPGHSEKSIKQTLHPVTSMFIECWLKHRGKQPGYLLTPLTPRGARPVYDRPLSNAAGVALFKHFVARQKLREVITARILKATYKRYFES